MQLGNPGLQVSPCVVSWDEISHMALSQGAAFAAIVTALLEKPETYPPFLINGRPPHPPT